MDRYFAISSRSCRSGPLRDWGKFRWQDNLLSVIWLYNRTGSAYLLDLARLLHSQGMTGWRNTQTSSTRKRITADFLKLNEGNGLKDLSLATHGVNNGQAVKTGPVWSLVSGSEIEIALRCRR